MGNYRNWAIDPFATDTQYYIHVQSAHYSGTYDNLIAAESENFPPTSSTRLFMDLPLAVDVSDLAGTMPVLIYDVTSASTLTRTGGAPGSGEYRVVTNTDSKARQKLELHTSALGHTIGYDYYGLGGVLSEDDVNSLVKGVTTVVIASSDSSSVTGVDFIIDTLDDAGVKINSIASGLSNGGTIKALAGTYNVSTIITLDDDVNLIGEGNGTSFVKSANIANVINISTKDNIIIRDLSVNGVKTTYTGTNYRNIVGNSVNTQYFHSVSSINADDDGFYDCIFLTNCFCLQNGIGFSTCYNISGCVAFGNTSSGFYNCDEVSACTSKSSTGTGFESCENISSCFSDQNGVSGFLTCKRISSSYANSNTGKGFDTCTIISSCEARQNTTVGFFYCTELSACYANDNTTYGFQNCTSVASSRSYSNTNGFQNCDEVSGSRAQSNSGVGFDTCKQVSSCVSRLNTGRGFDECRTMSACNANNNGVYGFIDCYEISGCYADSNTSDGYKSCLIVSACTAVGNSLTGFNACNKITSCFSTGNTIYGFYNCKTMGFNQSSSNTTANYNTSYADSGTANAAADTAAGGYNY